MWTSQWRCLCWSWYILMLQKHNLYRSLYCNTRFVFVGIYTSFDCYLHNGLWQPTPRIRSRYEKLIFSEWIFIDNHFIYVLVNPSCKIKSIVYTIKLCDHYRVRRVTIKYPYVCCISLWIRNNQLISRL